MKTISQGTNRTAPILGRWLLVMGELASFLVLMGTGIVKIPSIYAIFGLTYRSPLMVIISAAHDWGGFIFGALVVAHAVLHWRWFVNVTKRLVKGKNGPSRQPPKYRENPSKSPGENPVLNRLGLDSVSTHVRPPAEKKGVNDPSQKTASPSKRSLKNASIGFDYAPKRASSHSARTDEHSPASAAKGTRKIRRTRKATKIIENATAAKVPPSPPPMHARDRQGKKNRYEQ